ncbi:MAG: type IV secretion protein IcmD [Gammaproteobacteria bacterium]
MKTKHLILIMGALICLCLGAEVFAAGNSAGIGGVALKVKNNLSSIAKLITAMAYVGGMAFAIGAIVKFKAHKDNPTQIPIGTPIALLFIGAALIFIPSVFSTAGGTLFGSSGTVAGVSGITSF